MRWTSESDGYCSPRHRMPFNSINEGSKCVWMTLASNICAALGDGAGGVLQALDVAGTRIYFLFFYNVHRAPKRFTW